jgi:N-acetylglucosaminyldiphosphoundecaprenol N-acetyl-beta-D-mannosaminyltransferase
MIRYDVLGVPFDAVTLEEAVQKGMTLTQSGGRAVTPNPEIVWACQTAPAVMDAVAGADLILADGVGITKAARKLGRPLPCRVTGADWFFKMLEACALSGKRVFFLGGKPGVAQRAKERAEAQYPGLIVCGTHDGYFSDDGPVLDAVKAAGPDFLAVCLGAPKQELWMARNAGQLGGTLLAGLGGCLDVLAGTVKRAPKILQKAGLEWLYRVICQPSRIKRLFVVPKFLRAVSKQVRQEKRDA